MLNANKNHTIQGLGFVQKENYPHLEKQKQF